MFIRQRSSRFSRLACSCNASFCGCGVGGDEAGLRSKVTMCTPWRAPNGVQNSCMSAGEEAGDASLDKQRAMNGVSQVRETLKKIQKNLECPICLELLSDPYTTQCSHPFCRACIYTVISTNKQARCPLCKEPISKRSMNENTRLGEIVEAVKELEQAIVKDTGIQSTPPRPIPTHSREATGTPGIIIHSLLHPTPIKSTSQLKRTEDDVGKSESTSGNSLPSDNFECGGTRSSLLCQASTSGTRKDSLPCSSSERGESHGKLSIKRRRKKRVKFSMEKPSLLPQMLQASASSPTVENVESTPNTTRNVDEDEDEASPVRKKVKVDLSAALRSAQDNTMTQQGSVTSPHLCHGISRVLETPAPIVIRTDDTATHCSVEKLTQRQEVDFDEQSSKCNELGRKKQPLGKSPGVVPGQEHSQPPACELIEIHKPQQPIEHSLSSVLETPFIQPLENNVTHVLETPFVRHIQASAEEEENEEQGESVLTVRAHSVTEGRQVPCETSPNKCHRHDAIEQDEDSLSDDILARDSEHMEYELEKEPSLKSSNSSIHADSSCTVLGPTQVHNVPETQLNKSALLPSYTLPDKMESPLHEFDKAQHRILSQRTSSSGSTQSTQGSPTLQSGGTVCINETQFTKAESQNKICSPSQSSVVAAMPSPPPTPDQGEVQSPVIPLQNSVTSDHKGGKSSGRTSKIAETQLSTSCVPCSQPSPSYSKPKSTVLPGLSLQYQCQQPPAVKVVDESLCTDEEKKQSNKRNVAASPKPQIDGGLMAKSPSEQNDIDCFRESSIATVVQNENGNGNLPTTQISPVQAMNMASINMAFLNLQSQRDSLQSQISCSMDLNTQQLELLRHEMDAKQREINELEGALRLALAREEVQQDSVTNSTQTSVKSVVAVADTFPDNTSTSSSSSSKGEASPEQPVACTPDENCPLAHGNTKESSDHSLSRREESGKTTQVEPTSADVAQQKQIPLDSELTNDHLQGDGSSTSDNASVPPPPHAQTVGRVDEADSTSMSVEAILQAADDVLKKLKDPPLAVLEERSHMEIDEDLCTPSRSSIKAKLHVASTTATPNASRVGPRESSAQANLQVDSELYSRTNKEAEVKRAKPFAGETQKGRNVSTTSKKKKKKVPLVVREADGTLPGPFSPDTAIIQNQATAHPKSSVIASESGNVSSPNAAIISTPSRAHSSRESDGDGAISRHSAVTLRTPKVHSCNSVAAVSPCRPLASVGKDHPPSYVGSGLTKPQLRELQTLARRHGGRLASCFNGSTSHVIITTDKNGLCSRTIKYLQGVATGRWIVSHHWVSDSLKAGRLLQEANYEVIGDHVTSGDCCTPMRSRQLHQSNESPGLFADYAFVFVGEFGDVISQDHLAQLIQLSGGHLISDLDDLGVDAPGRSRGHTFVVCNDNSVKLRQSSDLLCVSSDWILDCLSNYRILPSPISP